MISVALLNIGSEILIGRTVNTNASQMSLLLRAEGYPVNAIIVCHDTEQDINLHLDALLAKHDAILVTGGLGPTKDDITKKVLLERFGGEMKVHEPTLTRIRKYLESRDRPLLERNRLQAVVPSSCDVLENHFGTAPGMAFKKEGKVVISMPGVPMEMEHLMTAQVIPYLKRQFPITTLQSRIIRTAGIAESAIAEKLEAIEHEFSTDLQIAYLPSYAGTKIELRLSGSDDALVDATLMSAQRRIGELFEPYVYALEDLTPPELLGKYLLDNEISFAAAESCTGGTIASYLVHQSGVSRVFRGGVVAYQIPVKEQVLRVPGALIEEKGVVSEEVVLAMARGVRDLMGSDAAVATTGIAQAGEDEAPEVWIGFVEGEYEHAIHMKLFRQRKQNIEIATQAAIIFALRELQRKK